MFQIKDALNEVNIDKLIMNCHCINPIVHGKLVTQSIKKPRMLHNSFRKKILC